MVLKSLKKNCLAKKSFSLAYKKISDKEVEHAFKFWNKFEIKTIKDYHDLYLNCDAVLLADVFEKFRNNSLKIMLNMTEVEIELIPDPDMYLLFAIGKIDRVSELQRYSKVNNKYLKSYDPKQESKHIIYLDVKDLYGYAIPKFLPTSGFKWVDPKKFELDKYTSNSSKGCVIEVNLEYSKKFCELRNDYPLIPDKIEIKKEMLSRYQLMIAIFTTFL